MKIDTYLIYKAANLLYYGNDSYFIRANGNEKVQERRKISILQFISSCYAPKGKNALNLILDKESRISYVERSGMKSQPLTDEVLKRYKLTNLGKVVLASILNLPNDEEALPEVKQYVLSTVYFNGQSYTNCIKYINGKEVEKLNIGTKPEEELKKLADEGYVESYDLKKAMIDNSKAYIKYLATVENYKKAIMSPLFNPDELTKK